MLSMTLDEMDLKTFGAEMSLDVSGIKLELFHSPAGSESEIAIYWTEGKMIFSADNIYDSFPVLFPLHGGEKRCKAKHGKLIF